MWMHLSIRFFENILLILHKIFVALTLPFSFLTSFFVGIGCCILTEYALLNPLKNLSQNILNELREIKTTFKLLKTVAVIESIFSFNESVLINTRFVVCIQHC